MIVAHGIEGLPSGIKPSVATIGNFDGVHLGHQALIRKVLQVAGETGATPALVTFDRHPLAVIAPDKAPRLITTLRQRAEEIERLGVEILLILRFDDELRHLSPEDFVRRVIVDALGCAHVVAGGNFRFGYQHAGTIETLTDLGNRHGFGVTLFALVEVAETVSSSLIRRHIADGLVEEAAEELGRPFRLEGVVEAGAGRGKGLGIPTANLRTDPHLILPKLGVYAGWVRIEGQRHPAVINVGLNPTFEDRDHAIVEAHALDFDADLYGKTIEVEFTHRLRDELKFRDVDSLMEQIRHDIGRARALLGV